MKVRNVSEDQVKKERKRKSCDCFLLSVVIYKWHKMLITGKHNEIY